MDKAVYSALGGTFINLGQNCIASERVIVLESVYDEFIEKVTAMTRALRQGKPERGGNIDVGAIVSPLQIQVIEPLVQDAIDKGATVLAGGKVLDGEGNYYPPTILTDLTDDMRIIREEVFGPIMLIFKVKDEQEAIELANSTEFGLQSSIITRSSARGERIASRLHTGGSCINDFGMCYLNQDLPFGGVKYSGFGRMNGRDGLRDYTNQKAVMLDRFPIEIPPKIFPVKPQDYEVAKSSAYLLFAPGIGRKCRHLFRLASLSLKNKPKQ